MKKQIEVKVEVISDKPIFSYHLLEISKNIELNTNSGLCIHEGIDIELTNVKVTVEGLFFILTYDNENYETRRSIQRFITIKYYTKNNTYWLIDDDYLQITEPTQWFKTINSNGMLSEYYVVEYEDKKYLFTDHLCGNREIFDIENDKVYKDFLNRRIPCDFKTDIYKKYLKDKDMTNSEWTVKEFKNNKMNYNFTIRMY